MYSSNTKTTNELTASNNKSRQTIGEHLGNLKYLEISKYKRESKARMSITFYCLIFVNCGLFSFLNIKRVKIYIENTVGIM